MPLTVLQNPLAAHLLTRLRAKDTPPERFRPLTRALTHLLVAEAAKNLSSRPLMVETPLETFVGTELAQEVVLVPVLRAGLGMLDAALELLFEASVGYVGLQRDEETAIASAYYSKLPALGGKSVLMLDPMLATGGSAAWTANLLTEAGAELVQLLCVVAAPEGVAYLETNFPNLHIVAASLDRELNDRKYILPGLGDFGDRLYGTF